MLQTYPRQLLRTLPTRLGNTLRRYEDLSSDSTISMLSSIFRISLKSSPCPGRPPRRLESRSRLSSTLCHLLGARALPLIRIATAQWAVDGIAGGGLPACVDLIPWRHLRRSCLWADDAHGYRI